MTGPPNADAGAFALAVSLPIGAEAGSVEAELLFLLGPGQREVAREPGDGQVSRRTAFRDGLNDARRQIGERRRNRMWRSASFSRLAIVPKSSAGSLTIVSIPCRDRAMAVSSEARRASSISLCRVGECATPLRSGRVGTNGIGIVEAEWKSRNEGNRDCRRRRCAGLRIVVLLQRYFDAVRDKGSITVTSGVLAKYPMIGSGAVSMVNAGLEGFTRVAALEATRGVRVNVVCPGWVKETMVKFGMDPTPGKAAVDVARAYVEAVEGSMNGNTIEPK